jgi:hypothetical protein
LIFFHLAAAGISKPTATPLPDILAAAGISKLTATLLVWYAALILQREGISNIADSNKK